ncbi:hypothetical protein LSAT2_031594 [Lamellibrachia satsuma]|nr:hypothetical protein LSAT2_031594 [Lamellibrachia satsuma]
MCAIITAWTVVALCSLIITSLLNLGPYIQEWRYRRTTCNVVSTFYTTQYVCWCGVHCQSTYPCFFVHVTFNDSGGVRASVGLYRDTAQQKSVIDVSTEHQEMCSLRVCHGDSAFNRREIADFQKSIGHRGTAVFCYFDPENISSGAVLRVVPAGNHVLHALLWPAAASVVGVTACVVFCRWCRRQEAVSARKDSHVALQPTTITLGGPEPDPPLETTRVVFDDCRTLSCDSNVDT